MYLAPRSAQSMNQRNLFRQSDHFISLLSTVLCMHCAYCLSHEQAWSRHIHFRKQIVAGPSHSSLNAASNAAVSVLEAAHLLCAHCREHPCQRGGACPPNFARHLRRSFQSAWGSNSRLHAAWEALDRVAGAAILFLRCLIALVRIDLPIHLCATLKAFFRATGRGCSLALARGLESPQQSGRFCSLIEHATFDEIEQGHFCSSYKCRCRFSSLRHHMGIRPSNSTR